MEEQKKREEHEELTKKCRTEKESSKKRKKEGKCEINGQNVRGKTEESLHIRHILIVHVALSKSNIN